MSNARLQAPSLDGQVISIISSILRAAIADADTAAPNDTFDQLEHLDARIRDAEVVIGRVAVALLDLHIFAEAMTAIVGEVSTGLETLRT